MIVSLSQCAVSLCHGNCIGPIHCLAEWTRRLLNQHLVSFASVCVYVGSFTAWLFSLYVLLLVVVMFSSVSDWLRSWVICISQEINSLINSSLKWRTVCGVGR